MIFDQCSVLKIKEVYLYRVFTWRQADHVGVPNESRGSWIFSYVKTLFCSNKFA